MLMKQKSNQKWKNITSFLIICQNYVHCFILKAGGQVSAGCDYFMRFSLPAYSTYKPPLTLETGLEEEQLSYVLAPGETLSAPELLIQELPDRQVHSGTVALHRYANKNLSGKDRPLPVVSNTWLDKMTVL